MNKRMGKKKQKMEKQIAPAVQVVPAQSCPQEPAARAAFYIQYQDKEYLASEIEEKIKEKCLAAGLAASALKELSIYVKPEDQKAYYTCGEENGFIEL